MKFKQRLLLLLVVIVATALTLTIINQNQPAATFTKLNDQNINTDRALNVIKLLSSESYDGRMPGTEGNEKTVSYLVNQFQEIGLKSPESISNYQQEFEQPIVLHNQQPSLKIKDSSGVVQRQFNHLTDFLARATWPDTRINGVSLASMVYIKNVAELEQKASELSGYAVLVDNEAVKQFHKHKNKTYGLVKKILYLNPKIKAIIINNDIRRDNYYPVSSSLSVFLKQEGSFDENGPMVLYTTNDTFAALKKASLAEGLVEVVMNYTFAKCRSMNVLGVIEGADSTQKEDYIIIGAHLDHVGNNNDGTYNPGALDNASGIAGLLEIARAIKESGVEPQKSILFIAFNGEEEYLAGSRYYVDNPVYPLQNACMINLDMIGSKNSKRLELIIAGDNSKGLQNSMYKSTKALGIQSRKIPGGSSDHVPFTEAGVPAVFLINLEHEPRVHTVNDIAEKTIDMEKFREAVRVVLHYLDKNAY